MARTPKVVEDRRDQIIESALYVFAQKGFDKATNKDIAKHAGITPGLIYHYFESKESLLQAIIERGSPIQSIRALPTDLFTQPPDIFLRYIAHQILEIAESEPFLRLVRVFLPEILHNPNFALNNLSTLQEATQFLENYLASKIETGELQNADPALTAQVIMSTLSGFVLRRQVLHDPTALQYSHEQIIDSIITTIVQGLMPR